MKANPHLKECDDPMIERAAADFLLRAAREGHPRERGMSLRIGDLVMVFGVPLAVGYYAVLRSPAGEEGVRFLREPSEGELARLSGD